MKKQTSRLPPLKQRFGFSLVIIARGFFGSESRKRFESGMGVAHGKHMGHHRMDINPVEHDASTLATLDAKFGVSKGSRDCKRPRVGDQGLESEIFQGCAKPIVGHASCAGLFALKSVLTGDGSRRRGITT